VIELTPRGSRVEVKVAMPVGFSAAVPSVVDPLENVTVPVGTVVPEPDAAATVAISSTGSPCTEVSVEAVRVNALATVAEVTVTVTSLDVEAAYEEVPP
jgi:ABC-type Na+ efflux pump permease subunit